MVKKITPDPPTVSSDPAQPRRDAARLLDSLALTLSRTVDHTDPLKASLFVIQPGVTAHDALSYVSQLLAVAELNGDEIGLHANPVERTLFWGMLHSVEMARAVVDALLAGSATSPAGDGNG
ncbi:hypothetical protein [Pseudomonas vanderleydeniana]|uniref:DUF3077 domain-containing protein n=1 Tax=Pseudomonas vanderleydeniana TaxID=2745495 RepID=A0A9E6PN96_9PSED|nr:hypothetical protein [Pseudomonas vanderleydeniana]QXI29402.1 hypothetical protein HU752_005425 [Pseudomonas vanderleydeniana]